MNCYFVAQMSLFASSEHNKTKKQAVYFPNTIHCICNYKQNDKNNRNENKNVKKCFIKDEQNLLLEIQKNIKWSNSKFIAMNRRHC